MVIGYYEKVDKIVVYDLNGKRSTKHLAVYGLNNLGTIYTYYNKQDGLVHILDKSLISKIKLYSGNKFVKEI